MPSKPLRSARLVLVLVAVLALGACSDDGVIGEEPLVRGTPTVGQNDLAATPSTSPQALDEAFDRIPDRVGRVFFPPPPREQRRWVVTELVLEGEQAIERPAFPCRRGTLHLDVDTVVLDHAETVRVEGDFLVSQQLTVYPVGSRAGRFADDLAQASAATEPCGTLGAEGVLSETGIEFREDPALGVKDHSTLFAETVLYRSKAPDSRLVDVVTRRGNAVVWTRIVSDAPARAGIDLARKRNPEWVDLVRQYGNRGVRALAALTPIQR